MRQIVQVAIFAALLSSMSYMFLDVLDRELQQAPAEQNIEIPE